MQDLFQTHLSKHSVGAYKKLCQGAGDCFWAIPAGHTSPSARVQHVTGHECVVTQHGIASVIPDSDETIAQTQIENQQFMDELNEWKLKAETELEERKRAEVMFRNLEVQIEELQTNNSFLEQELNRWKARTRCLEASATGCYHTVMEAVSQLLLTGVDGVLEF